MYGARDPPGVTRTILTLVGCSGALAVLLGAFGAHGLKSRFAGLADGVERLSWWATATQYHLIHTLALALVAWMTVYCPGRATQSAFWLFTGGTLIFSGTLYLMTLTGTRWLGAITPIGGTMLVAGWIAVAIAAAGGSGT